MLKFIVHLFVDAGVLLLASNLMTRVTVKDYKSALWVAFIIALFSILIGWLFVFLLNLATLGIFYFIGLGIITRTIANAIIIEITDAVTDKFKTEGFITSLILAALIAVVGSIVDGIMF